MNRREFLSALGAASAVSMVNARSAFAENTTNFYVKGLVMVSFEDAEVLRLGFPKAHGHKATVSLIPHTGSMRMVAMKGNGSFDVKVPLQSEPRIFVPELVRMKEFYGDGVRSQFAACPNVISIPYSAIRSVTTHEVTKDRYTFVRADNGQEVNSFRPRKIAESLKIELSSSSVLKLDNGKVSIPLETSRELWAMYAPAAADRYPDMIGDHFHHYFHHVDRPAAADFSVVPRKITGNVSQPTPRVGNNFAMMMDPWPMCWMVAIP